MLGVITARHAEGYRVDIGSSQYAALDALAFEGATKRSKPNLKVGSPSSYIHNHTDLRLLRSGLWSMEEFVKPCLLRNQKSNA